jgi:hypothetical protein
MSKKNANNTQKTTIKLADLPDKHVSAEEATKVKGGRASLEIDGVMIGGVHPAQ